MAKETKDNPVEQLNILKDSVFFENDLPMEFKEEPWDDNSVDKNTITDDIVEKQDIHNKSEKTDTKVDTKKETTEETEVEDKSDKTDKSKETKVDTKETEEKQPEESGIKVFASWLGEQGIVDFDAEKFEDSEDGLKSLVSNSIQKGIQSYKNSLPEDLHKFVEFVEAGGNPKQFIDVYYNQTSWEDFEVTDDKSAKSVLTEYLKAQGEDSEDIKETLETYETSGLLEKKAKTALGKLQKYESDYKAQMVEAQKKYDEQQRELAKQQIDQFKEELYSKEEINGFKLTPGVKDKLWDFIMTPDRKTGKTGLQLHNETNKNSQFLYAYLAMNNWDFEKLEKQVKTKVHSELASKLKNVTDSRSKIKSGQSDNFGDQKKNNFSAFKQALEKI